MANRRTLGRGINSLIPDTKRENKKDVSEYTRVKNQSTQNQNNRKVESDKEVRAYGSSTNTYQNPTNTSYIGETLNEGNKNGEEVLTVDISMIKARPGQPRKSFDDDALNDLAESIREYGLLNPIVITKVNDHYEIIAGERRFRATQKLGKKQIQAIVKDYSQKDVEVVSLIENVQREDLSPIEEADAYRKLADSYQMTQEQIAKTMGKSRSYVANMLRLLNLKDEEKAALNSGKISSSQARTLLSITSEEDRAKTLDDFINNKTNIRKVENSNKKAKQEKSGNNRKAPTIDDILAEDLEERFMEKLGSKVAISKSGKAYKLVIDCYSIEDIEEIYSRLEKNAAN